MKGGGGGERARQGVRRPMTKELLHPLVANKVHGCVLLNWAALGDESV